MKKLSLFLTLTFFVSAAFAQKTGSFKDSRDGKTYKTVTIGKQVWMAENLAYKASSGCWAYDASQYGYLYNWETAKKVCPNGWHLPSDAEWKTLIDYLGGEAIAGKKLKSESGWYGNGNGNNESGFNALPGGYRFYDDGSLSFAGRNGSWWSSTPDESDNAWRYYLKYSSSKMNHYSYHRKFAYSVRCIKD